jgi:hypothetical protein
VTDNDRHQPLRELGPEIAPVEALNNQSRAAPGRTKATFQ